MFSLEIQSIFVDNHFFFLRFFFFWYLIKIRFLFFQKTFLQKLIQNRADQSITNEGSLPTMCFLLPVGHFFLPSFLKRC